MIAGNSAIYYKGSDILNPHLYIPLAITTADKSGIPYTVHIHKLSTICIFAKLVYFWKRTVWFLMEWIVVRVVIYEGVFFYFPLNKE